MNRHVFCLTAALFTGTFLAGAADAADLRIALADDPDALDPATLATHTGLTVLKTMCERLMTTDEQLNVLPGLAEHWEWSDDARELTLHLVEGATFHDGSPFDAEAVRVNLDRLRGENSLRQGDLSPISEISTPDAKTVVIRVAQPATHLVAKLAERMGIMMSPAALEREGDNIGRAPVCIGPYKFAGRVAQDHILLEKDPDYRLADLYAFDSVLFRIIPDDAVRLANLQSGDVDLIEKLDPALADSVAENEALETLQSLAPNNQALMFNLQTDGPMQDVRVRRAFEQSLDKQAIVDVVFAGRYRAANQFVDPDSPFYNTDHPIAPRDIEAAKGLLAEAGLSGPVPFTILVPNRPLAVRAGEMMQIMSAEAGFDTRLDVVDFATTLQMTYDGNFEAWGPIGPQFANDLDLLARSVLHSDGPSNVGKYSNPEVDRLIDATRAEPDPAARADMFREISAIAVEELPVIYLYHQAPIFAFRTDLEGLHLTGDGFIQLDGVTLD